MAVHLQKILSYFSFSSANLPLNCLDTSCKKNGYASVISSALLSSAVHQV